MSATTPWRGWCAIASREASLASDGLVGPAQVEWLDRVRDDLESYRGALTWLIDRGRPAEASDIAWGLMAFWLIRGHAAEGLQWYERTLKRAVSSARCRVESARRSGVDVVHARGARARTHAAARRAPSLLARRTGDMVVARDRRRICWGTSNHAVGNLDAARDRFTRSLGRFRALAMPWGIGNALSGLAAVALCDR